MADDTVIAMGGNAEKELARRIERRVELAEEAAELKQRLGEMKAEDKNDGYDERAIADAVKLKCADPEKVLATMLFEEERKLYRRAAGLPVTLEAAQKLAEAVTRDVPEPKSAKSKGRKRDGYN